MPGKSLNVVAIYEVQAAFGVNAHELLHIFRIDAAVIAAGLPRIARVVAILLLSESRRWLLEKDRCPPK